MECRSSLYTMTGCLAANETAARVYYFLVFGLTVVISWVLRDYAQDAMKHVPQINKCFLNQAGGLPGDCAGKGAVLRVSFGNFIFFALHFILLLGCRKKKDPRTYFHNGCLTFQTLLWAGIIGSTFAMPNHVFFVWGQIARVLGGIFLVIQICLILEFVFTINDYLTERDACKATLILSSSVLFVGSFAVSGLAYYYYAKQVECTRNICFITFTLVGGVLCTGLSVSPFRMRSAGLMTAGMVFGYAVFLLWSALSSEPDDYHCVFTGNREGRQQEIVKIIGFIIALLSVVLGTFFSSTEARSFSISGEKSEDDLDYIPDFFHLIYMLASAYVAMLFLSWTLENTPGKLVVDKGWVSSWIHMASQWLSYLLYLWILLAPRILRGRNFDSLV